ncbi:auxin-responsive protein IAA26 isoform X5 [Lactuca sativa]|uniref:auxin-responsive protein IAA26 isoform X5 n=1 Tax=Lactuca sativa TaxID=4236 RepID=UPI0022AF95F1|nr:auxin-responsive protein IAA26 isoform X5 [Lactuca sativa]
MLIPLWLALVIVWYISLKIQMEGYPKPNKVMIKEACEETRLELRLCPPGDGLYSIGTTHPTNSSSNTLMFKSSSKRVAQPPAVVGWPPVRSSRKNIMTSSYSNKINMDGVVIGRKVDLKAYDNYQSLSSAVDELFRGHLAARGDASSSITNKQKYATSVGLLERNGEFTLLSEF